MPSEAVNPDVQHSAVDAGGFADRLSTRQRGRMLARFLAAFGPSPADAVVDVGVTADEEFANSNYFELGYPYQDRVTAVGLEDATFLERVYPGLRFVQANGLDLPFADGEFDYAFSSAVIEHVGTVDNQATFVAELARVSRKGFFLTTPNRWFPIEFHTVLPLIHWLPRRSHRGLLRRLGHAYWAQEEHLNLLSARDLRRAASVLAADEWSTSVESVRLGGLSSNLMLVGRRRTS